MIDKTACHNAVNNNTYLPNDDKQRYHQMCEDGLSIAQLFREEIPKHGNCQLADALNYIKEEEDQMSQHFHKTYDMDEVSVAEHVLNEDLAEPDHAHQLYSQVGGDVKFFQEWLEGHHPAIGCYFNQRNQVPTDTYYGELEFAREEAARYRNKELSTSRVYNIPGGY